MLYAGIDASPRRVAVFIVGPRGGYVYHDYAEFEPEDDLDRIEFVVYALDKNNKKGLRVTIEGAYLGPNKRGSLNQAELIGTIKGALLVDVYTVNTMLPAAWRSACGITGRGKQPVMDWAIGKYGDVITNQDIADAAAIAYAASTIGESNG